MSTDRWEEVGCRRIFSFMHRVGLLLVTLMYLPVMGVMAEAHANPSAPPAMAARTVMIGAEDDAAPWSYVDGTGYVNDVVVRAFAQAGWKAQLSVVPYARCKLLTIQGTYVACFTTSKIPELEAELSFPEYPVISVRSEVYANEASRMKSCSADTLGEPPTVAMVREYEYPSDLEALRGSKRIRRELTNSEGAALKMLKANRVDAAVFNLDAIKSMDMIYLQAGLTPDRMHGLKRVCEFGPLLGYLAFSKKNPDASDALAAFAKGIAQLQQSGEIKRLQASWAAKGFMLEKTKLHNLQAPRP